MDQRQAALLLGLVREYIRSGLPVGSSYLTRELHMPFSAATVRMDLRDLEESGYLFQPHTSAGRVPTDGGYRYYVDHTRATNLSSARRHKLKSQLSSLCAEYGGLSRAATKLLARLTNSFAVSGSSEDHDIQQDGFALLLDQLTDQFEAVHEISAMLAHIDEYVAALASFNGGRTVVFIGQENPVFTARHTSILVRTVHLSDNEQVVFLVAGPRRMRYERNIALLESVAELFAGEDVRS